MVGVFHPVILIIWAKMIWSFPFPDRPVVFPGEKDSNRRLSRLEPQVDEYGNPVCASSGFSTFCENVSHYPAQDIRRLIKIDQKTFKDMFSTPGDDLYSSRRKIIPDDFSQELVCGHRSQTFFPKMGKNENSKWRYVINDVDYVQAIVAEICEKDGKPCAFIQDSLPSGYQSTCKQRFSYKKLLAIDPDEKKTYMDSFQFPSCCSCYVKAPFLLGRKHITPKQSVVQKK